MAIDCHVLEMPGDNAAWAEQLRADLSAEGVSQHWLPGIQGALGAARAEGYRRGSAEFVSYADPDDRIIPGTFAALVDALEARPFAPFAWAGEQVTDAALQPQGDPDVWPEGYCPRRHQHQVRHVHGVVLYRRTLVERALPLLERAHAGADWLLGLHLAQPNLARPDDWRPVHVPIVGRLWRQHRGGLHREFTAADRAKAARLAGITPQYLHVIRQAPQSTAPPCLGCGP